jgi:acyl-coenzyme A thioesterase PaaI-like protein
LTFERTGGVIAGPGVRPFQVADHHCFACGSLNEQGMRLVLHVEPGIAWTELELEPRFEGWAGIAHGGILCTILDEVMAWALVGEENWGLTARLSVEFKRPVPVARLIRAHGEVTRNRRRLVETAGRIVDAATGEVLATATATYLAADGARRTELQERYGFRYVEPATQLTGAAR